MIDGGVGTDTYQLNGVAGAEVFRIYTRAAAVAAGLTGLSSTTEIVVTRNTNGVGGAVTNANIIAELDNIEEITVSGLNVSANDGNGTPNGGPSVPQATLSRSSATSTHPSPASTSVPSPSTAMPVTTRSTSRP